MSNKSQLKRVVTQSPEFAYLKITELETQLAERDAKIAALKVEQGKLEKFAETHPCIEIGDTVVVCFNGAQITLCYYAIVLSVPLGVGDPWVFQDTQTGFLHYVSEGCTVSKRVEPQATGEKEQTP